MALFTWHDCSKNDLPTKEGGYIVYLKNGEIKFAVWDNKKKEWVMSLMRDKCIAITHWVAMDELGKPYIYNR